MMDIQGLLSVVALVVSFASVAWTIFAHRSLVKHESVHANMAALVELYNRIESTPTILRFHGVSEEELNAAGLTAKEFAYLVASFEAASVYYRFHEKIPKAFKQSSLRYRLLANPATRRAWPLLSRFFESDTAYRRKIDATLRLFDSPAEQTQANPTTSVNRKAPLPGR
jgi:hypothetical protein